MIRVLIADDHPIMRLGLAKTISRDGGIEVAGEAENSDSVLELLKKERFDVLVMDINMPGRSGLEVLGQIRNDYPGLPVLLLSMYPEEQYAVQAYKSGASGYLNKQSAPEELVKAIRKIAGGGRYVSPALAEKIVLALESDRSPLHYSLSGRELQVLRMISSGETPRHIAETLSVSVKTVNTYRGRLLEKLNARSNADLIRYALENSLVD